MMVCLRIGKGVGRSHAVESVDLVSWSWPGRRSRLVGEVASEPTVNVSSLAGSVPISLLALMVRVMRTPPLVVIPEANRVGVIVIHEQRVGQRTFDSKCFVARLLGRNAYRGIEGIEYRD